jgi:hypothetical protein
LVDGFTGARIVFPFTERGGVMSNLRVAIAVLGVVVFAACASVPQTVQTAERADSRYPQCSRPQNLVLTPIELKTATTELGSVKIGAIEYKATPHLQKILSSGADQLLVTEYIVCVAKAEGEVDTKNGTDVNRMRRYLNFVASGATPAQQIQWQKDNP